MMKLVPSCVIAISLSIVIGCSRDPALTTPPPERWSSDFFAVTIDIPNGWKQTDMNVAGDTHDRRDQLIAAFMNPDEGCLYVLRIERDGLIEALPMVDYVAAVRRQFEAQPAYRFRQSDQVSLHGVLFERLQFAVAADGKNSVMDVCLFRDGEHLITIQMSRPDDGTASPEL
ncbi:MAG: hypothetical protein AAGJ83_00620, partial [Planctomycetota bacterium]